MGWGLGDLSQVLLVVDKRVGFVFEREIVDELLGGGRGEGGGLRGLGAVEDLGYLGLG